MSGVSETIEQRLEYLRGEIHAERISMGELAELQSLAEYIDPGDAELLEWAGVPEEHYRNGTTREWAYADKISTAIVAIDADDKSMFYVKQFTIAEFGEPVAVVTWNSETAEYDVEGVRT